jgi:prepilin-type N-terminal cleavage/methylation domain-containing protein
MRLRIAPSATPTFSPTGWNGAQSPARPRYLRRTSAGFSLIEVVMATAVVALIFGGVIRSYTQAGIRIEWTGYSLAAQQLANQVVEQAKAATWDPTRATGPQNDLTNMALLSATYTNLTYSGYLNGVMDIPYSSTNIVMAKSYVTVTMSYLSGNTNIPVQFIRVDTVWPFRARGNNAYFTNTVCTMIAPDNASNGSF